MQNAKWNSIDEYDDISTKDQYKMCIRDSVKSLRLKINEDGVFEIVVNEY